ncbi:MAG: hypothetical protein ACE5EV_01970 [Gaiellales bacterium]
MVSPEPSKGLRGLACPWTGERWARAAGLQERDVLLARAGGRDPDGGGQPVTLRPANEPGS